MGLMGTATKIGIGYVLGTRAGRERYEQLAAAGKRLAQHPQVQRLAEHPQVQQVNNKLPQAMRSKLGASSAPGAGAPPRAMVGSPTVPPVVLPEAGGTSAVGTPLATDPPSASLPRFDA